MQDSDGVVLRNPEREAGQVVSFWKHLATASENRETLPNRSLKPTKAGLAGWTVPKGAGWRASLDTFPRPCFVETFRSAFAA